VSEIKREEGSSDSDQPSRMQKYVTHVPIKMHDALYKQDSIHRDAINSRPSLEASLVWKPLCLSIVRTLQ
jgi:hypothetical protein